MNSRLRNLLIVAAALAVVVVLGIVAAKRNSDQALSVPLQRIALTTFVVKLPENGVVMHPHTATIPALVGGNLGHVYVRAGDEVTAGELLATIDNPSLVYQASGSRADYVSAVANIAAAKVQEQNARVGYQAAVETNRTALDEAKRVYDEDVELFANKAIPRNQLDADKTKFEQARVAYEQSVEQAKLGAISGYNGSSVQYAVAAARKAQILNAQNQQQLAFTHVVAPFDGTIQTVATQPNDPLRSIQPGDAVTAGQSLFTIAGGSGFIVKAEVDEQDVINVKRGQRANITGQDFPGKTIVGHVTDIAPVATKSTDPSSTAKQVLTTIALESSPAYLRDGMSADVDILTSYVPNAIAVPNDAVYKSGSQRYVFTVVHGTAHKQPIRVARVGDTQTQVASGLKPGDVIVSARVPGLTDGRPVKPHASPSPSASPAQP
jgi:HlyD family secretion protein